MSTFDDRVQRLINDRVNDLEQLFLTESENRSSGIDQECCENITRKVNEIKHITEDVSNVVNDLRNQFYKDDSIHFGDIVFPADDGDDDGLDHDHGGLPEWMMVGIPPTIKDLIELLVGALGGKYLIKNLPRFLGWLLRRIPDILSLRTILPLLALVASLWRGLGQVTEGAREHVDTIALQGDISQLKQKLDDMMRLLSEIANGGTSGGDTSILTDRLQQILDNLEAYYGILAGLARQSIDQGSAQHQETMQLLGLMRADGMVTDSDVQCALMWLKGTRNCDEFDQDVITLLHAAQECCQYVRCHLDEYYIDVINRLQTCCESMQRRMDELKEGCEDIKRRLEDPGNPLDTIQDTMDQGNVVGTGSLVLNYANDLNIIKAKLDDIRRLL